MFAEGTPQGSDVGEGAGENDRALSIESDDELAGGLDPGEEMGMPPEYLEGHEPNKRPRMVAKPMAAPGPSTAQGFGPPENAQHAVAMLPGFDSNQLINCFCLCKLLKWSKEAPLLRLDLMRMLGVSVGSDVVEEDGQWKLVCRRKNKTSFKTFQKRKDKVQSSFGMFGIPFGESGPRPLQEACTDCLSRFFSSVPLALVRMFSMLGCRSGSLVRLS